jgi:hypothetical protein
MDLAGPFKKWKVDFLTGQCRTDKSSKARHIICTTPVQCLKKTQTNILTNKKLQRDKSSNK